MGSHRPHPKAPVRGPSDPVRSTPGRRPDSVRRTVTIDVPYPDLDAGRASVQVRARDLVTSAGVRPRPTHLDVAIAFDVGSGEVLHMAQSGVPVQGAAGGIVGASIRSGLLRNAGQALPEDRRSRTLRWSAIEDVPGAVFVAGYALLRSGVISDDPASGAERARHQADVCAGWADGAPLLDLLRAEGRTAQPSGPAAPSLEGGDPMAWHAVPTVDPGTFRRRRRLDLFGGTGGGSRFEAHLRDTYAEELNEIVLHEYLVTGAIDAAGIVESIEVEPRVLPWQECPAAVSSAQRVVGIDIDAIASYVRGEFTGASTCTHLNSTLRSLADLGCLSRELIGIGSDRPTNGGD